MSWTLNSKAAQVGIIVAILVAITIGVAIGIDSWTPIEFAIFLLPAVYVAVHHRPSGRRSHGQHS